MGSPKTHCRNRIKIDCQISKLDVQRISNMQCLRVHLLKSLNKLCTSSLSRHLSNDISFQVGAYENILVSRVGLSGAVGLIKLNKPKSLNAISSELLRDLASAVRNVNLDRSIKCVVLTGDDRAFAAGADIKELSGISYSEAYKNDFLANWTAITACTKPVIAVVNGIALGGGCELAMMCDIIYAGDRAKFGQPEIKLGIIPGAGGTQRLIRAIGKSRAMEMILSGEMITAKEAAAVGLVSRVYPAAEVLEKAIALADRISRFSCLALRAAKDAINSADNTALAEGLKLEKLAFYSCLATNDCKAGMEAFLNKHEAIFTDS